MKNIIYIFIYLFLTVSLNAQNLENRLNNELALFQDQLNALDRPVLKKEKLKLSKEFKKLNKENLKIESLKFKIIDLNKNLKSLKSNGNSKKNTKKIKSIEASLVTRKNELNEKEKLFRYTQNEYDYLKAILYKKPSDLKKIKNIINEKIFIINSELKTIKGNKNAENSSN